MEVDTSILRPVDGSFETGLFQPRYQRNNKRGGLKNLRCFPTCAAQHKERGFCGRPVFMNLKTNEGEDLLTWAEFVKTDEPKSISIGHSISLTEAEARSRSKEEPLKPWIKGVFTQKAHGISKFEFNREKRGWHYGWASNKHTCNASHALVAWVFERSRSDPDTLICRGVIESPSFMLFCRRRRRFTLVPSAPIAEPRKSKASSSNLNDEEEDDDDFDDDDEEDEEEEEKPKPKKKASPALAKPGNKKAKFDYPPPMSNGTRSSSGTGATLDKNRVDALLTLLHMAWRKMKDTENSYQQSSVDGGAGDLEMPPILDVTPSQSDAQANASTDAEFYQMLEFLSGDLDLDGFGFDPASAPTTPVNTTQVQPVDEADEHEVDPDTEALAKYLLEEPDFRQSVLWLRGQGENPDFSAFLSILRDHIQKYMKLRFWTINDVDRLIEAAYGGLEKAGVVKTERHWMADVDELSWDAASAAPGSPRHFVVEGLKAVNRIPNITGVWKQTRESQIAMEQFRESTGSSWVMSKLFEFMESKFSIQQQGVELSCRLWPMPAMKFVLDAEEHPWGIRLPLFQPNWTYRAWTDGEVITLQHQIENRRLTRKYWCDPYRKYLYSEATLEIYDSTKFVKEARVKQTAERVS